MPKGWRRWPSSQQWWKWEEISYFSPSFLLLCACTIIISLYKLWFLKLVGKNIPRTGVAFAQATSAGDFIDLQPFRKSEFCTSGKRTSAPVIATVFFTLKKSRASFFQITFLDDCFMLSCSSSSLSFSCLTYLSASLSGGLFVLCCDS